MEPRAVTGSPAMPPAARTETAKAKETAMAMATAKAPGDCPISYGHLGLVLALSSRIADILQLQEEAQQEGEQRVHRLGVRVPVRVRARGTAIEEAEFEE